MSQCILITLRTESDYYMANRNLYRIEMLILKVLEEDDCYGYQLTQTIKEKTGGQIVLKEGTLYPVLYRLLDQGFITDRKELVGRRQTRVYYHLEPAGKEHLDKLIEDYYGLVDAIQCILGSR